MKKILVAYFSASGVTRAAAETLAKAAEADLLEIRPETPYTDADLNWNDPKSRSTVEMKDRAFRPKIVPIDAQIAEYDVVFLGFPIWWYVAPTIINTFLESYDFSGKRIILFATSGGSGFGRTVGGLRPSVSSAASIEPGRILNRRATVDELREWIRSLKL